MPTALLMPFLEASVVQPHPKIHTKTHTDAHDDDTVSHRNITYDDGNERAKSFRAMHRCLKTWSPHLFVAAAWTARLFVIRQNALQDTHKGMAGFSEVSTAPVLAIYHHHSGVGGNTLRMHSGIMGCWSLDVPSDKHYAWSQVCLPPLFRGTLNWNSFAGWLAGITLVNGMFTNMQSCFYGIEKGHYRYWLLLLFAYQFVRESESVFACDTMNWCIKYIHSAWYYSDCI